MRATEQPNQRTGYWFRQLLTTTRLNEAFERVAANHGGPGVDGQTIADFSMALDVELSTLQHEVLTGKYAPRALLPVTLQRPGKKARMLGIPSVRDRVLQTACTLTITPVAEREFEDSSFGYRQGRSVKQAVARIERLRDEGFLYVVDADIAAFFDEIPHPPLLARVDALFRDGLLTRLIQRWLETPVFSEDGVDARTGGIAQGSPLSPLLANVYLDQLDEAILAEGLRAVRYADDFVILCKTPERATAALELTRDVLTALQLRLNADKTRIASFQQGFRFLGALFVQSLVLKAKSADNSSDAPTRLALTDDPGAPSRSGWSIATPHAAYSMVKPPLWLADTPLESAMAQELREAFREHTPAVEQADAIPETRPDALTAAPPVATQSCSGQGVASTDSPVDDGNGGNDDTDAFATDQATTDATPSHHTENLLHTLYVVTANTELAREGESLVMRPPTGDEVRLPANRIDLVVLIGQNRITTPAMQLCLIREIPVAIVGRNGRYYGMLVPPNLGYVTLQLAQVARHTDREFCLTIARNLVRSKLENSAVVLHRLGRRHDSQKNKETTTADACTALRELAQRTKVMTQIEQLMGLEGAGARRYLDAIRSLLPPELGFSGRQARPAPDPVNALLSFGYTLLYQNAAAFLQARGLNPSLGFLHVAGGRHLALASDLMEPLRAVMVDAVVLDLLLNQRIPLKIDGLGKAAADGSFRLNSDITKVFLHAIEARMTRAVNYAVGAEPSGDGRRLIDAHARALVSAIRQDDAASFVPVTLR